MRMKQVARDHACSSAIQIYASLIRFFAVRIELVKNNPNLMNMTILPQAEPGNGPSWDTLSWLDMGFLSADGPVFPDMQMDMENFALGTESVHQ